MKKEKSWKAYLENLSAEDQVRFDQWLEAGHEMPPEPPWVDPYAVLAPADRRMPDGRGHDLIRDPLRWPWPGDILRGPRQGSSDGKGLRAVVSVNCPDILRDDPTARYDPTAWWNPGSVPVTECTYLTWRYHPTATSFSVCTLKGWRRWAKKAEVYRRAEPWWNWIEEGAAKRS